MQLPFERTISGAYRWTFRNFVAVLGIAWLPHLLMLLCLGGLAYAAIPNFTALLAILGRPGQPDSAQILPLVLNILGLEAIVLPVVLVFSAMATVGLVRKALGLHPGPDYIFFSLDSQVWRLIGAYILLVLVAWGGIIAMGVVIALIAIALSHVSQAASGFAIAILGIAAFVFYLYALVRTWFFIPPIVVAENHIGLRRSWHLGYGNFWRIIGIFLAITLPMAIAFNVLSQAVMQLTMPPLMALGPKASPQEAMALLGQIFSAFAKAAPFLLPLWLLYTIALSGLLAAAGANAYRLVTGGEDIGPPAPAKAAA